jgi:hypothetical protein
VVWKTSRYNIRYQIRRYQRAEAGQPGQPEQDSGIQAARELVAEMRIKYPAPTKIIMCSGRKLQPIR